MRKGTKIAAAVGGGVVATAVILGTVVGAQAAPEARVGTGYAAQAGCVQRYINATGERGSDLPDNPITGLLTTGFDQPKGEAEGSIFGLYSKTSYFTPGVGCTVADERPEFSNQVPEIDERVRDVIDGDTIGHPEVQLADEAAQRQVDSAVKEAMGVEGARGVVVVKDGNLISESYADGFTENTAQLGWSMTKSVANVLTGRVAELDPTFDVRSSALSGIPWADKSGEKASITYSDLLRMQSGLSWDETYDTTGDVAKMLYTSENMGEYVASKDLEHTPGTYREYSTGSTTLECAAMQAKSPIAQRYGVALAWETLFKPVGMASAMLSPDATGSLQCGSSAYATPRDWAKLGQFVMDNGSVNGRQLLPEGWMRASLKENKVDEVQSNKDGSDPGHYGSGWWLNSATTGEAAFGGSAGDGADGGAAAAGTGTDFAGATSASGASSADDLTFSDLPADMFWADGHDGQFMIIVPSQNLIVVRQGFSPGTSVESSKTMDIVRAVINSQDQY